MGGGLGGSSNSTTKVPKWQEDAAKAALARANQVASIGYTPYYGPDVAALTPMQLSAMRGTNQAATAFGMPTTDLAAGLPVAQDYNGMQAYSSGGLYDQAVNEMRTRNPEQYAAIMAQFGSAPAAAAALAASVPTPAARRRSGNPSAAAAAAASAASASSGNGFTSLRDMIDGGGAGASGSTFRGGPLSNILNRVGVQPASQPATRPAVARPVTPTPTRVVRPVSRPATTSTTGRPTRGF
jgi:hypothetical protein